MSAVFRFVGFRQTARIHEPGSVSVHVLLRQMLRADVFRVMRHVYRLEESSSEAERRNAARRLGEFRSPLGVKQLTDDPWATTIPQKYRPGVQVKGTVTKLASFGAFVEIEENLEGLLHVSEIADRKIEKPEDVLQLGQELELRVINVDSKDRKIGLSLKPPSDDETDTGVNIDYSQYMDTGHSGTTLGAVAGGLFAQSDESSSDEDEEGK